jgi:hypothetical protein
MKKESRLLFLALSVLMVTCSTGWANYKPSFPVSPASQSNVFTTDVKNFINPFLPFSKNNKKTLADVTLLITNDYYTDFDVMLYNTVLDEYWLVNISPNTYQEELTVPEGTYDITFWPNDMGRYHHYYSVSCGPSGGGVGTKFFYGVSITSAMYCNYINIE